MRLVQKRLANVAVVVQKQGAPNSKAARIGTDYDSQQPVNGYLLRH